MKLISKEITLAAILAMPVTEQDELARTYVKGQLRLKETGDEQKEGAKVVGKLLCALEIRLENGKKANAFAPNKTLAEFFKETYGAPVQTHPLSLKNAYGAFVATGFIKETDYDCNSGNCLEIAARIVTAVNGDLPHAAVAKAAKELVERSNKEAKNLREILASVKPVPQITADEVLTLVTEITEAGHLGLVIAVLPDMILGSETNKEKYPGMNEADQRANYGALISVMNTFDRRAQALTENVWADITAFEQKPKLITSETPAPGSPETNGAPVTA